MNVKKERVVKVNTTIKLAEPSRKAVKVRCLRLSLLSGTGMLFRPITFVPSDIASFGTEPSSSELWFTGIRYPTSNADINLIKSNACDVTHSRSFTALKRFLLPASQTPNTQTQRNNVCWTLLLKPKTFLQKPKSF